MWQIRKTFDFCYGHRVWSQELEAQFSEHSQCSCRHLHGHNADIVITLESSDLDHKGMVTDFGNLGWFKKFLKDYIDHKFIIDSGDPLLDSLINGNSLSKLNFENKLIGKTVSHNETKSHIQEYYDSFVIVNFIPTSENLAKWLCDIVSSKMSKLNIKVASVDFYETQKSKSRYINK